MKVYFALSDIHGRIVSLDDFKLKGFDECNNDHEIVLVGDYFDRYDYSEEVLSFCEQLLNLYDERVTFIKGNHDEFIMTFVDELDDYKVGDYLNEANFELERWLRNGGRITIEQLFGQINGEYTAEKFQRKERLKSFLKHLVDYYETDSYIFTHASIDEKRVVDVWNRDFFHEGMNTEKTVIIGHTTYEYLENFHLVEDQYLDFAQFNYAVSNEKTACKVYDIDNAKGNNITVFTSKNEA